MPALIVAPLVENPPASPRSKCELLSEKLQRDLGFTHLQEFELSSFPNALPIVPEIVLLRLSGASSVNRLIQQLKAKWPEPSILALLCPGPSRLKTETRTLPRAVNDFVCCPYNDSELFFRIKRLLPSHRADRPLNRPCDKKDDAFGSGIVGTSASFLSVIDKIPLVADVIRPVLITGETGSGKEVIARAIHYQGFRKGKPFVPINCGALPDQLFENELFGHVKGAFTDASSAEKGLIAEAEGGTLFLDEVDALSQRGQVKLLRFLQDQEYRPLGSSKSVAADLRIVAASNADLRECVQTKLFREDLYYRLNVLPLFVPPLRERVEDIPVLASYFLNRYASQYNRSLLLSPAAVQKLMVYHWPGNVRELEAVIHRAAVLSSSSTLQPCDIDLPQQIGLKVSKVGSLHDAKSRAVAEFERSYLANLLTTCRGNITQAAKVAGKERRSFQRLVQKYGLNRQSFQS